MGRVLARVDGRRDKGRCCKVARNAAIVRSFLELALCMGHVPPCVLRTTIFVVKSRGQGLEGARHTVSALPTRRHGA